MKVHSIHISDILVPKNRQRKEFNEQALMDLASSIARNGLIHPVVIRRDSDDNVVLVCGERRIRAMHYVWNIQSSPVKCGEYEFAEEQIPCIFTGEMDPIDALEMEIEENVRRTDFTWQEKCQATERLAELRGEQAKLENKLPPTTAQIAEEVTGNTSSQDHIRKQLIVSEHLGKPEVAKAKSLDDAYKLLKRQEEADRNAAIARQVGATLTGLSHTLRQGDCFEIMSDMPKESFDVILTDPPYGIDADKFNDSSGMAPTGHFYADDWTTWHKLIQRAATALYRVAKPNAHLYLFCDIDNFVTLKGLLMEAGWRVFRTPIIWVNPSAIRAPWPSHGPQRKYQICAFAIKGDRPVTSLSPDVITYPSDPNLGWAPQKPVQLYMDLLRRSVTPGNTVLDPFGGSGPILPAAHGLSCIATYIEQDPTAFGIAVGRTKELK